MASIYLRGKTWWLSYVPPGDRQRKKFSLQTTRKDVAEYKKREFENRLALNDDILPPKNISVQDAFDEFINSRTITSSKRTVQYYQEMLSPLIRQTSTKSIIKFNERILINYLNSKPNIQKGTVWHIIKCTNTFMRFCVARNFLPKNPITIKKPKLPKKTPECWTKEETKRILAVIDDPLIYAMVYINLHTGLRPNELRNLRWADIDLKKELLTVREAKDGEFRHINLHPNAVKTLKNLPKSDEYLFRISQRKLCSYAKKIREKSDTLHIKRFWYSIRHTFATEYYNQTGDLRGLQEILGHSKIEMTTVYVNSRDDHRRAQIRKLSYEQ